MRSQVVFNIHRASLWPHCHRKFAAIAGNTISRPSNDDLTATAVKKQFSSVKMTVGGSTVRVCSVTVIDDGSMTR